MFNAPPDAFALAGPEAGASCPLAGDTPAPPEPQAASSRIATRLRNRATLPFLCLLDQVRVDEVARIGRPSFLIAQLDQAVQHVLDALSRRRRIVLHQLAEHLPCLLDDLRVVRLQEPAVHVDHEDLVVLEAL